jgi:threonyl-tRNA synthetase
MLVIGEKEASAGSVSVRMRHGGDAGTMQIEDFAAAAAGAIMRRDRELVRAEVKDR